MRKQSESKDPLIAQLEQRMVEIDANIEAEQTKIANLRNQRIAALNMLAALSGKQLEVQASPPRKRGRKASSKSNKIFEVLERLVQMYQRGVGIDEILQALGEDGVSFGKNDARRRSYIGAVLSNELKKSEPRIVRSERGTYSIK